MRICRQEKPGQYFYRTGQIGVLSLLRREEPGQCLSRVLPQSVDRRHLVHAGDGAIRGARLDGFVFALEVFTRVVGERNGRVTALLRTVMNQPVFTDVQVAAARAAMPLVR